MKFENHRKKIFVLGPQTIIEESYYSMDFYHIIDQNSTIRLALINLLVLRRKNHFSLSDASVIFDKQLVNESHDMTYQV
jgi:hypothetical protein